VFSIAIIGSGPAGCYLAEHLLKLVPESQIDILEKLPVPFGLIRYGVAPDHQGTKAVARVLDRTLSRDRVRFFGNAQVGRDVTLDELRSMYDAVALATGAPSDRKLGIAGEDLPGVIGSGAFVNWYNAHPTRTLPDLCDVSSAVIIGNGNVALDVARLLAKGRDELKGSDLATDVLESLELQPIKDIHIVGRRSAGETKFSEHELEELGTLQRATPWVECPGSLAGETAVERVLRGFAQRSDSGASVAIRFHFGLTPLEFLGNDRLQSVRFRSAQDGDREIAAQLAITCIGYDAVPCCSAVPSNGAFANQEGRIEAGLYVVGWAKRGPSGTIPTNRSEALQVAQKIAADLSETSPKPMPDFRAILKSRGVRCVDYAGWKRIEAAELSRACEERCRLKLLNTEDMLRIACDV
jgi:ferredoxin--NADP+ reductase